MERVGVQSSNIASIGYDPDSYTLEIEFLDGSVYQYFDVPENIHEGLLNAESHGKFLNQVVKGHFRYARL